MKINLKNTASLMLLVCAVIMALSFNSCKKDKNPYNEDGQIPGLGNVEGNLTGTAFKLPEGIELMGEITGDADQYNYWDLDYYWEPYGKMNYSFVKKMDKIETRSLSSRGTGDEEDIHYFGSGPGYVDLLIPLRNKLTTPVTITFPAATIIRSQSGECQNGVLLKKVVITIPANSNYKLCLSMYCGNSDRGTAGRDDVYVFTVVSDAKPLLDLCDLVKNKKVNIEEYERTSYNDYMAYGSITYTLQSAVWDITDGEGIDQYTIEEIKALPNSN